jgi:hypothetical protein
MDWALAGSGNTPTANKAEKPMSEKRLVIAIAPSCQNSGLVEGGIDLATIRKGLFDAGTFGFGPRPEGPRQQIRSEKRFEPRPTQAIGYN